MNMYTQLKEKINISVDSIEKLTDVDLADLCNITEPVSYTHLTLPTT